MAAKEETVIQTSPKERAETDLPWNVIVFNDPINLMSYVTLVFQRVFGYPRERAEMHMLEVHELGRSILWTGHRELAESYVEKLHGHLLLAQIEKAGQS